MQSSYAKEDVEILLKDISGMVEALPAEIREKKIQQGRHYCEMLPLEYKPSEKYMAAYEHALENDAEETAEAICLLAEKIYRKKKQKPVLLSLARAGIPIGILLRRYLKKKYHAEIPHYAISIIRGRGIDKNALAYILKRHPAEDLQFVDGWIGKGAILGQLREALSEYPELDPELAVVSDPANLTELCGTHEDILIPSSCLNATVTGLISRTFLREDIIGPEDFHGAAYYGELEAEDLSEAFLTAIEEKFCFEMDLSDEKVIPDKKESLQSKERQSQEDESRKKDFGGEGHKDKQIKGREIVKGVADEYGISDLNFIKPGIGEATRVLLRRIPWKIIVNENYAEADELKHIYQLAAEKGVSAEISKVELGNYKVCGIIRRLSDV